MKSWFFGGSRDRSPGIAGHGTRQASSFDIRHVLPFFHKVEATDLQSKEVAGGANYCRLSMEVIITS